MSSGKPYDLWFVAIVGNISIYANRQQRREAINTKEAAQCSELVSRSTEMDSAIITHQYADEYVTV